MSEFIGQMDYLPSNLEHGSSKKILMVDFVLKNLEDQFIGRIKTLPTNVDKFTNLYVWALKLYLDIWF